MVEHKIETFNGVNFNIFEPRIRGLLAASKLAAVFQAMPEGEALLEARAAQEARALGILTAHVEDAYLDRVTAAATIAEALESLRAVFVQQSIACRAALRTALHGLKLQPGESANDYLARAKRLSSQLAAAGAPIAEDQLALAAIAGLPDDYSLLRQLLELNPGPDLTVESLLPGLLLAEQRVLLTQPSRPKALYSSARGACACPQSPTRSGR